jgi:hypothetical protein
LFENATLLIEGDLTIGSGVQIIVGRNGFLKIGGKETEREAFIGSGSKIYVFKKLRLAKISSVLSMFLFQIVIGIVLNILVYQKIFSLTQ